MARLAVKPGVTGVAAGEEVGCRFGKGGNLGKGGTLVSSKTLLTSILVLAAAVVIFLAVKNVLCRTGAWSFGAC